MSHQTVARGEAIGQVRGGGGEKEKKKGKIPAQERRRRGEEASWSSPSAEPLPPPSPVQPCRLHLLNKFISWNVSLSTAAVRSPPPHTHTAVRKDRAHTEQKLPLWSCAHIGWKEEFQHLRRSRIMIFFFFSIDKAWLYKMIKYANCSLSFLFQFSFSENFSGVKIHLCRKEHFLRHVVINNTKASKFPKRNKQSVVARRKWKMKSETRGASEADVTDWKSYPCFYPTNSFRNLEHWCEPSQPGDPFIYKKKKREKERTYSLTCFEQMMDVLLLRMPANFPIFSQTCPAAVGQRRWPFSVFKQCQSNHLLVEFLLWALFLVWPSFPPRLEI